MNLNDPEAPDDPHPKVSVARKLTHVALEDLDRKVDALTEKVDKLSTEVAALRRTE
jgi:hypothetical protein